MQQQEPLSAAAPPPEPLRVVVVDDEPTILEVVCGALEDAGLAAQGCSQAAEAFWFIQRDQPDLVILDVQMPGVDGITLLQHLRADPRTRSVPVLFLTANSRVVRQRLPDYAALGATILPKPFELAEMLAQVQRLLATAGSSPAKQIDE